MQVDTIAMLQGISEAYYDGEISYGLYSNICERVELISSPGETGRKECDYDNLFVQFGMVPYDCTIEPEPSPSEFSKLWKRLGDALASGISVAN